MARTSIVIVGLLVVLVGAQFVPVDRSNPSVEEEIDAPAEVTEILQRACYDCHSNTTRWPWYSRVAPASWVVAHDVKEGRAELNFSTWNRLSPQEKGEAIWEVWEEVEEGEMPLWSYRLMHKNAALSDGDREVLRQWGEKEGIPEEEDDDADDDD